MSEKYLLPLMGCYVDLMYRSDYYPKQGDFSHAKELGKSAGGPPFNVGAVAASKGINVKAIDYLGIDDSTTEFINNEFRRLNVDSSNVQYGKAINGKVIIINTEDKRTMFVVDPIRPYYLIDEKMQDLLNNATYIYSLGHIVNRSFENIEPLLEARRHGAKFIFDGTSKYENENKVKLIYDLADGMFINSTDYQCLKEKSDKEPYEKLLENGCEFVCITDGEKGATCYCQDGIYFQEALKGINVIDSTGAGDSFAGAFLAGRIKGYSIEKCLKLACASGGYACEHLSGLGGVVSEEELLEYAKKHGLEIGD